jgi:hypothetical protein
MFQRFCQVLSTICFVCAISCGIGIWGSSAFASNSTPCGTIGTGSTGGTECQNTKCSGCTPQLGPGGTSMTCPPC